MGEPDILGAGLTAVFCGINRPPSSGLPPYNFVPASNRFWCVLHLAGFTDVQLPPRDERRLLTYGYGITAVVQRETRRADELSARELREARPGFEARIRQHAPRALAFLGKLAVTSMLELPDVAWGRQPAPFAGALTWVLPNPSGRNRAYTLDALVRAYAEFRRAIS